MSLVVQIVVTTVVGLLATILLLVAVIGDQTRTAWVAFALGIVAHALFLDARMRWREAHRFSDNLRSIQ